MITRTQIINAVYQWQEEMRRSTESGPHALVAVQEGHLEAGGNSTVGAKETRAKGRSRPLITDTWRASQRTARIMSHVNEIDPRYGAALEAYALMETLVDAAEKLEMGKQTLFRHLDCGLAVYKSAVELGVR